MTEKAPPKKATPAAKKAPTTKAKTPTKGSFAPDDKITPLKDCPWREGTKGAANFAKYKSGMTVAAALKAGVPRRHLHRSVARGAIKVGVVRA